MSGWDLSDAIAMSTATPRDGRLANSTFDRTAGSHSLAAAGQRERYAALSPMLARGET